jgi:hypothetical protein
LEQSIKQILSTIDEAIGKFQSSIPGIQKLVYDELQPMLKEIKIKDGKILNNVDNLRLIGNLKNKLEKIIVSTEYKKSVQSFIDSFGVVSNLQQDYFAQFNDKFKAGKTLPIIKQLAVESTINGLIGQGMVVNIVDPIQKILNQNITTGGDYANFQDQLRNHILSNDTGDGSLVKYTKQISTDAINQFNAQYHKTIAEDLQFNWCRYVGSNITTSREFCIYLTKKQWIHRSEFPEVLRGIIDDHKCKLSNTTGLPLGMIPGTNVDNFNVLRGGYTCGHQAFWVPDSAVPEDLKAKFSDSKKEIANVNNSNFETKKELNPEDILNKVVNKDEFINIQKEADKNLMDFIDNDWTWVTELKIGQKIKIPANAIAPDTIGEWNDAKVNASFSDQPIKVHIGWGDILSVRDGHNRLKTALQKDPSKLIEVIFVGKR